MLTRLEFKKKHLSSYGQEVPWRRAWLDYKASNEALDSVTEFFTTTSGDTPEMRGINPMALSTTSDFAKAEKALCAAKVPCGYMTLYDKARDISDKIIPDKAKDITATEIEARYASLAPYILPKTTELRDLNCYEQQYYKQEGYNTMTPSFNKTPTTAAVASNITIQSDAKSDAMIQREYLLEQLAGLMSRWQDVPTAIRDDLQKLFHINANPFPTDPEAFVEAIKKGKFKLDTKRIAKIKARDADDYDDDYDTEETDRSDPFRYSTPLDFIEFTDLPKPDHKGYTIALEAYKTAYQATKNIIVVKSPDEGLQALMTLQAWKYKKLN